LQVAFYVLLQNPPGLGPDNEVINPATGQPEGIACMATGAYCLCSTIFAYVPQCYADFHSNFLATLKTFVQASI
jgi:hypothetical protein